jgi:ribosomal-protein-alanine N-acetyltransferase
MRPIWDIEKLSFPSPWSRYCFLSELSNPVSTTLVAGPPAPEPWQVWGYIIYWVAAGEMHILNLAVHPDLRCRGIARALLTEALRLARLQKAAGAWLEVRSSNRPAQALYESFGFTEVGLRPRYYADTQEDALIMELIWEEESGGGG